MLPNHSPLTIAELWALPTFLRLGCLEVLFAAFERLDRSLRPPFAIDDLPEVAAERRIAIAIIATPASAAQDVADRLVAAGVPSILNFAPTVISVPDEVSLRKVDLAVELQILSYHEQRRAGGTSLTAPGGQARSASA